MLIQRKKLMAFKSVFLLFSFLCLNLGILDGRKSNTTESKDSTNAVRTMTKNVQDACGG